MSKGKFNFSTIQKFFSLVCLSIFVFSQNTKALYALVVKAIKNGDLLNCIIRCSGFLVKEKRIDPWLARVLITELIWGSKRLPSGSKPCDTVMNYSEEFSKQLENAKKIHNLKESNTPSGKYIIFFHSFRYNGAIQ